MSCHVPFISIGGHPFPREDIKRYILNADIKVEKDYEDGGGINTGVSNNAPSLSITKNTRLVHVGSKEAFNTLIMWLTDEGSISALGIKAASEEIDADPLCKDIPITVRDALISARIGQGKYRQDLMKIWGGRCAVTGCAISKVLIASHTKSWKISTNEERLDPYNGFLLAASVDRLFDRGLISFMDSGELLVDKELNDDDLKSIGLTRSDRLKNIDPRNIPYLQYHREKYRF